MSARSREIVAFSLSVLLHASVIGLGGARFQDAGGASRHLSVSVASYEEPAKPVKKEVEKPRPDKPVPQSKLASKSSAKASKAQPKKALKRPEPESHKPPPQTQAKVEHRPPPRSSKTKAQADSRTATTVDHTGQGNQSASVTRGIALPKPDVMAMPLYHLIPKPPYPSRSRDLGEEGSVIVAILVSNEGNVAEAYVATSSGYSLLDGSALKTVKEKWKFKPATRAGKPVETWVRVPIRFDISGH